MRDLIIIICFLNLLIISACKDKKSDSTYYVEEFDEDRKNGRNEMIIDPIKNLTKQQIRYGEVLVDVRHVSALDFIEKTGRKIGSDDIDALLNESVFIMDFKSLNPKYRNPLNLNQCKVSFDEGVKFLAFEIEKRLKIIQEDSVYYSNGVHFERDFSLSDRLRVVAFFKGVKRDKEFTYYFDDKIFGGGIQEFNFSNFEMYIENS